LHSSILEPFEAELTREISMSKEKGKAAFTQLSDNKREEERGIWKGEVNVVRARKAAFLSLIRSLP
jgi:hypothetical protein